MNDATMGNQQEVSEIELAWLAGLLNGDGCFSLTFRERGSKLKCDISLTLTQCDPSVVERTDFILHKMGITPGISEYQASGAGVRSKWNLRMTKMSQIGKVIEFVEPFMVGEKQAQSKLMKRYIDRRSKCADPSQRRWKGNELESDTASLEIAAEFYRVRRLEVPDVLAQVLRDYPKGVGASASKCTTP